MIKNSVIDFLISRFPWKFAILKRKKKERKIKNDLNRRHRGQEFMDHGKLR